MTYIGIEAGGSKFVCGTGSGPDDLGNLVRLPTTTPDETLGQLAGVIAERVAEGPVSGLGLATFGPVDLDRASPTYASLTTTPKPGWAGVDLLAAIRSAFTGPVAVDTDVNGAALGELRWGAGQGLASLVYVTVGTGVGGGAIVNGKPIHGLLHPEMGHLIQRRHPDDDFAGCCPAHGDCFEGLACGPAWLGRWGQTSSEMDEPTRVKAVEMQACYMAQMVVSLVLTLSPQRIVFGGGVLAEPSLLPEVRRQAKGLLNGYVAHPSLQGDLSDYVVSPALGDRAGVLGAIALAQTADQ